MVFLGKFADPPNMIDIKIIETRLFNEIEKNQLI